MYHNFHPKTRVDTMGTKCAKVQKKLNYKIIIKIFAKSFFIVHIKNEVILAYPELAN